MFVVTQLLIYCTNLLSPTVLAEDAIKAALNDYKVKQEKKVAEKMEATAWWIINVLYNF